MKNSRLFNTLVQNSPAVFIATAIVLVTAATDLLGDFLIERIVVVLFINLIIVLGLQMFMGNSGILAWAHIGFMGIGAYISSLCSMTPEMKSLAVPQVYPFLLQIHLPFLPSLLIGACVAALVPALLSYPLMRLSDAAAAITSFALLMIIQAVLIHWDRVTNGPRTLFGVTQYTTLWNCAAFAAVVVIVAYLFKQSPLGLKLRASREDFHAASSVGINVVLVRYVSFVLSAFIAGLGGGLWAHYITSFIPTDFYFTQTFTILAMLVVGGPLGVSGAAVGSLVVTLAHEGLRAIENMINLRHLLPFEVVGLTEVFLATALIVILILRPQGILGGREIRWPRRRPTPSSERGPDDSTVQRPT